MTPSHRTELVKTHSHVGSFTVHDGRIVEMSRSMGDGNSRVVTIKSDNGVQVISVSDSKDTPPGPKP